MYGSWLNRSEGKHQSELDKLSLGNLDNINTNNFYFYFIWNCFNLKRAATVGHEHSRGISATKCLDKACVMVSIKIRLLM